MATFIKEQAIFWFNSEFYAIGISAFVGASIRVALLNYLDDITIKYPTTGYGPFMQMFVTQPYMLPNFLGCFIMACCIVNMKKLSAISVPTYKFLTTGMCGCITTYSSWINGAIDQEFDNSNWIRYLVMLMLQFWLTWSSFTMGYAFVKNIEESPFLHRLSTCALEAKDLAFATGGSKKPAVPDSTGTELQTAKLNDAPSSSSPSISSVDEAVKANTLANAGGKGNVAAILARPSTVVAKKKGVAFKTPDEDEEEDAVDEEEGNNNRSSQSPHHSRDSRSSGYNASRSSGYRSSGYGRKSEVDLVVEEEEDDEDVPLMINPIAARISIFREDGVKGDASSRAASAAAAAAKRESELSRTSGAAAGGAAPAPTPAPAAPPAPVQNPLLTFFQKNEFWIWCILFWLIAIPLWLVLIALPRIDYYNNTVRRDTYRSIGLAPLGAWTRWGLTRFPKLKALYPEMNPQTMLANLIGVIFVCILTVYSTDSWVAAINDGFSGCCSTVSTFFAEIHTLYFEKGPNTAFRYAFMTFFLSIVAVQIIRAANDN